mgnify:FL=1
MQENDFSLLVQAILDGDHAQAVGEVENLLARDVGRQQIIACGIEQAMQKLNDRCTAEQYNLLELMLAGRAVDMVTKALFPEDYILQSPRAKVMVAALEGDIHDLGKNILKKVLLGKGYYVIDCGKDVSLEKIIASAKQEKPFALCISGLITNVVVQVKQLKKVFKDYDLGDILVLAGGAALKQSSSKELQVDFVGQIAFDAADYLGQVLRRADESLYAG